MDRDEAKQRALNRFMDDYGVDEVDETAFDEDSEPEGVTEDEYYEYLEEKFSGEE
jgi:hypothetical protein